MGFLLLTRRAEEAGSSLAPGGAGRKELGESGQGGTAPPCTPGAPLLQPPHSPWMLSSESQAAANYKRTLNSVPQPLD